MIDYLFTSWEGGGNVTPALEAVRKLVAAGHRVRFLSEECHRAEAQAAGASFIPWKRALSRQDRHPDSQICRDWDSDGLLQVVRDVWCQPAPLYAEDVLEELRRQPAQLVVTCEVLFGVMAACESIGQPFVLFCPNISLAPLPGVPPLGPGLAPATTPEEVEFHQQVAAAGQAMFDTGLSALNQLRSQLGLAPLAHLLDQFQVAQAELLATARAFDFPAHPLPQRVRYVGPQISDPHWAQPWVSPWPADDSRPLITVSFSTTYQNHIQVVQTIINALAQLPARVLVTRGASIAPNQLQPASNTMIVESAPHQLVVSQSALVVTHGGHGTVMRALYHGVPLVVIPHGRDQNDNAARVAHHGAGIRLNTQSTQAEIEQACTQILHQSHYRAAAQNLAQAIQQEVRDSILVQELENLASLTPAR